MANWSISDQRSEVDVSDRPVRLTKGSLKKTKGTNKVETVQLT